MRNSGLREKFLEKVFLAMSSNWSWSVRSFISSFINSILLSKDSLICSCINSLSNSKGSYYVTTPGSVMVRNACDQLAISCTKEGYVPANPAAGTVQDKAKKMAWGNIVFGGIIGIAVDRSTGAGCQYPQQNIFYPLILRIALFLIMSAYQLSLLLF